MRWTMGLAAVVAAVAMGMVAGVALAAGGGAAAATRGGTSHWVLDYDTKVDPGLQGKLEALDARLREKYGMTPAQAACGVMDLNDGRVALVNPDREEYAASVAKIGILLAYFDLHPEATTHIDPVVEKELGEMAKISSNEMASKYSHEMGLVKIQQIIGEKYHFYDAARGGGIWVGKHYGKDAERHMSPVGDNSHAITVRQVMRFWLMLEQGELVSPAASAEMRRIFETPSLPHDDIKFVKGLSGMDRQIIRKWGTWEDWRHDSAVVTGEGRHYIVVGVTRHPKGDEYLEELVRGVDGMAATSGGNQKSE